MGLLGWWSNKKSARTEKETEVSEATNGHDCPVPGDIYERIVYSNGKIRNMVGNDQDELGGFKDINRARYYILHTWNNYDIGPGDCVEFWQDKEILETNSFNRLLSFYMMFTRSNISELGQKKKLKWLNKVWGKTQIT